MRALLLSAALLPLPALAQEVSSTDGGGVALTLPVPAERVAVDSITGLGQLLALGLAPAAAFCPPGAEPSAYLLAERNMVVPEGTPCINAADWSTDWEAVAALAPDLFVGSNPEDRGAAEDVAPFFLAPATGHGGGAGDSLEMYDAGLRALGALTGREADAEAALAAMRDRLAAYEALSPDPAPSVLHVIAMGPGTFAAFDHASLNCQLLSRIARCAAPEDARDYYLQGTTEMLLALDPAAILVTAYDGDAFASAETFAGWAASDPLWPELRAVREGRVVALPHDARASSVWGIADYLDTVAPLLFPDAFPAPLTHEQVAAALTE